MTIGPLPFQNDPEYVTNLKNRGIDCVLVSSVISLNAISAHKFPDVALIDTSIMSIQDLQQCVQYCRDLLIPSIAIFLPDEKLNHLYDSIELDDFIIGPPRTEELELRASRLVSKLKAVRDQDSICIGDLVINTANFEVTVSGSRISLRYKEYELLLLMASNPGRVFSRDALLNQIWGYEYLGGTRTVDVHIRRLRSKIEDADHTFIETVWQVGYRFKPVNS